MICSHLMMLYQLYVLSGIEWYERITTTSETERMEKEAFRIYFKVIRPKLITSWICLVSYHWANQLSFNIQNDTLNVQRLPYILKNHAALWTILHGYLLQNDNYESTISGSRFYKKYIRNIAAFQLLHRGEEGLVLEQIPF